MAAANASRFLPSTRYASRISASSSRDLAPAASDACPEPLTGPVQPPLVRQDVLSLSHHLHRTAVLLRQLVPRLLGEMLRIEPVAVQWHLAQILTVVELDEAEQAAAITILEHNLDTSGD